MGLDAGAPVMVSVGRQEFQKGQVHLLRAMAMLRDSTPASFSFSQGDRDTLPRSWRGFHAALALDGTVRMLGHRDDVPELLAAGDVFVFPSLYEGIAGAAIEAMALRLRVVASDIPAMREVLEPSKNAVLVEPGDSAALADAVSALLADPGRMRRFSLRSRERFLEIFTLDRAVRRMSELYEARRAAKGDVPRRTCD